MLPIIYREILFSPSVEKTLVSALYLLMELKQCKKMHIGRGKFEIRSDEEGG